MPEEHPTEFHEAAVAAIRYARSKSLFKHLKGMEKAKALQFYVADTIARCVAPVITRERLQCAEKTAAAIAQQVAPLISSDKQRKQIARVIRNSKGGS